MNYLNEEFKECIKQLVEYCNLKEEQQDVQTFNEIVKKFGDLMVEIAAVELADSLKKQMEERKNDVIRIFGREKYEESVKLLEDLLKEAEIYK